MGRHAIFLLSAVLTTVAAGPVSAELVASSMRSQAFLKETKGPLAVPINNAGATSLTFSASAVGQKFVITFNAECWVEAWLRYPDSSEDRLPGTRAALTVAIKVNGTELGPKVDAGDSFGPIFCSSVWPGNDSFLQFDGFLSGVTVSASRRVVFTAARTGNQTLSFSATGSLYPTPNVSNFVYTYFQLDDIVITVER
jgi:hypothetical protein